MYQGLRKWFVMTFNLENGDAEVIKVIDINDADITAVNFGPFDNGHILLGLNDGRLLAFDYLTLDRLETVQVFKNHQAITYISFDPTNYVFVGGSQGQVMALTYLERKMHYLYLELGQDKYCTVSVPKKY